MSQINRVEKISQAKKRKKIIDQEVSGDWLNENSFINRNPVNNNKKQKKYNTKRKKNNDEDYKEENNNDNIMNIVDSEGENLIKNIFNGQIKRPYSSKIKSKLLHPNIPEEIEPNFAKLNNDNNNNNSITNILKDYNERKKKEIDNLPEEAKIQPVSNWILSYSSTINRSRELTENEIISNLSRIIDEKSLINEESKQVIVEKQENFKKPLIKQKKDELLKQRNNINGNNNNSSNSNVSDKEENKNKDNKDNNNVNSKELEVLKQIFFKEDCDEFEFNKRVKDYKIILEIMQDEKIKEIFKNKCRSYIINNGELKPQELPECSKSYINNYLIECKGEEFGHRECINGLKCMGMIMAVSWPSSLETVKPRDGFILREFLLPEEEQKWLTNGILPKYQKLCVLCNFFIATYRYLLYKSKNEEPCELLQNFKIVVQDKDGYNIDYCLDPLINIMTTKNSSSKPVKKQSNFTGITAPFLKFSISNYTFKEKYVKLQKKNGDFEIIPVKCYEESPQLNFQ
jgi:hypothetical protein